MRKISTPILVGLGIVGVTLAPAIARAAGVGGEGDGGDGGGGGTPNRTGPSSLSNGSSAFPFGSGTPNRTGPSSGGGGGRSAADAATWALSQGAQTKYTHQATRNATGAAAAAVDELEQRGGGAWRRFTGWLTGKGGQAVLDAASTVPSNYKRSDTKAAIDNSFK